VIEAVKKQLDEMVYAPSFMMCHEPAEKWAEALVAEGNLEATGHTKVRGCHHWAGFRSRPSSK